jgi:hypothetical protein
MVLGDFVGGGDADREIDEVHQRQRLGGGVIDSHLFRRDEQTGDHDVGVDDEVEDAFHRQHGQGGAHIGRDRAAFAVRRVVARGRPAAW